MWLTKNRVCLFSSIQASFLIVFLLYTSDNGQAEGTIDKYMEIFHKTLNMTIVDQDTRDLVVTLFELKPEKGDGNQTMRSGGRGKNRWSFVANLLTLGLINLIPEGTTTTPPPPTPPPLPKECQQACSCTKLERAPTTCRRPKCPHVPENPRICAGVPLCAKECWLRRINLDLDDTEKPDENMNTTTTTRKPGVQDIISTTTTEKPDDEEVISTTTTEKPDEEDDPDDDEVMSTTTTRKPAKTTTTKIKPAKTTTMKPKSTSTTRSFKTTTRKLKVTTRKPLGHKFRSLNMTAATEKATSPPKIWMSLPSRPNPYNLNGVIRYYNTLELAIPEKKIRDDFTNTIESLPKMADFKLLRRMLSTMSKLASDKFSPEMERLIMNGDPDPLEAAMEEFKEGVLSAGLKAILGHLMEGSRSKNCACRREQCLLEEDRSDCEASCPNNPGCKINQCECIRR